VDELIDTRAEVNMWDPSTQLKVIKKKGRIPTYPRRPPENAEKAPAGWGD
jgi:hypothetical protein